MMKTKSKKGTLRSCDLVFGPVRTKSSLAGRGSKWRPKDREKKRGKHHVGKPDSFVFDQSSNVQLNGTFYRVFFKKVFHKREEKMQEKIKMTQQEDKNLVQVEQHCSVYFCMKIILKSRLFWLIWPYKSQIFMILTIATYHENLLKDSTLPLLFIVKFFSPLETQKILKTPSKTFLRITGYFGCSDQLP